MERSHTNATVLKLMNKTQKFTGIHSLECDAIVAYHIVKNDHFSFVFGHSFKGHRNQISFDLCIESMIRNDFPRLNDDEVNDMYFKVIEVRNKLRAFRENLCLEHGNDKQDS
jgi:hypothetical protein